MFMLSLNDKLLCAKKQGERLEAQIPDEEDQSVKVERERVGKVIHGDNEDILMVQNLVKKYINKDPAP